MKNFFLVKNSFFLLFPDLELFSFFLQFILSSVSFFFLDIFSGSKKRSFVSFKFFFKR